MIHVFQVVSDTNVGGAGRYLLNYLRHFDRNAFYVTVLLPQNSSLKNMVTAFADVRIIEVPYMADKSYDRRCVAFLTKLFQKKEIDIIHTHASLSARIAARKAKIKTVISTRHCIEPIGRAPIVKLKNVLNNYLCDYYIAVSDAVRYNLIQSGIKEHKIRSISNGVDPIRRLSDEEKAEIRNRYGIKDETVFGIFARLEPVKGHRYFIEAAKQYLSSGGKGKFLIVGDGSLRDELTEQAKPFEDIIFTGYVKDTTELLNITNVNVLASESEAMSLAILEAMSLGIPTVATAVGGNGQLISNGVNGILTPYKDSNLMAEAFFKLSEDASFYAVNSENAAILFEQAFTAKIMVDNLERLYKEVSNDEGK